MGPGTHLFKFMKVQNRVDGWKKAHGAAQSDSHQQLEWASNVVEYVSHVYKATTIRAGAKNGMPPPALSKEVPLLGPRFLPPSYISLRKRNSNADINPTSAYLKPLHIVHPFYYPELARCPQCQSEDVSWQGWTTTGHREVHGVNREETALGYQLSCRDCESRFGGHNAVEEGIYCIATTNTMFWKNKQHWEIPSMCQHKPCAVTKTDLDK
jgi:hypothetical protein